MKKTDRTVDVAVFESKEGDFDFGNVRSNWGAVQRYLTYGGRAALPVTGEFHFSRYDETLWRTELAKMKAQGLDGVSVYVFWNHHELRRGEYDFSGNRDIRGFLRLCRETGLKAVLRIGPWCHGEVRYGGLPDYIAKMSRARTNNEKYLARVRAFWEKLYAQTAEFMDGETVIAIQLENEYTGAIDHIVRLKELAEEIGFKAPFFTMTAWPGNIPDRRFLPMFGGYPEAPWTQNKRSLPPENRFALTPVRGITEIGEDIAKSSGGRADFTSFPYATCETGTGNEVTNHRRPVISDKDGYGVAFAHFASGVNWLGYYMYHGGRNPAFRPMQETRRTAYPNNYPLVDYDFQAPLSKDGDLRTHAHRLRLMHYFIRSDTEFLAKANVCFARESGKPQVSVRTDGRRGYVFYANYERGERTQAAAVRVTLNMDGKTLSLPETEVGEGDMFFHPFNFPVGGVTLDYVAAQPIAETEEDGRRVALFMATGKPFIVRGGRRQDVEGECEINGTLLRFLSREQAYSLYLTRRGAAFSDGALYEDGEDIYVQLKEGESARLAGGTAKYSPAPVPLPVLERTGAKRLKYNSYMFSCGRRAYYRLILPEEIEKGCEDAEITLSFGGLNLQMFRDGRIVDDYFNTDGRYTFRLSGVGRAKEYIIRVCAPTSFGSGKVYNEINLKPGDVSLAVLSCKRISTVKL